MKRHIKSIKTMKERFDHLCTAINTRVSVMIKDQRGDLATNTIGGIIVAVIIIGLLLVAIKTFFPGFFNTMFQSLQTKLQGYMNAAATVTAGP